ncbi:hypothetical protein I317_07598 [Kwoniella heveanensis CBS 569]|nr:hypothetical protein I317_07598 [Kwoniella heveanensis CBS 569]
MGDKKEWLGKETFPTIWIYICLFFNIVGLLAVILLIVAEFIVLVNDFHNYVSQYGYRYPARGYQGENGCGYVIFTNAPKHMGSAVWMLLYQLSIIILLTLVLASDLAWRASGYNQWGGRWISAFYAGGLVDGEHNPGLFYYVVANAFLKAFIVILYMNQSFYGMRGHTSHESPFTEPDQDPIYGNNFAQVDTYSSAYTGTTSYYSGSGSGSGSGASSISSSSSSSGGIAQSRWRRTYDQDSSYGSGSGSGYYGSGSGSGGGSSENPWRIFGVEAFAYYMGWILLFTILPSLIAFMFLAPWGKKAPPADAEKKEEEKK